MPKKIMKFTFNSGVTVKGIYYNKKIRPMEFNSEITCENHAYKLFEQGINAVVIKSFTDPKKFYVQLLETPIGEE